MYSIQDNEIKQLRDLKAFLDSEVNFVEQYLGVLRDVQLEWCDEWVFYYLAGKTPPYHYTHCQGESQTG